MQGLGDSSVGEQSTCNAGDPDSIPGSGRSPGEGKDYPLQYASLENSMDCTVRGVANWVIFLKKVARYQNFTIYYNQS